jgi:hypothetical protein
MKQAVRPPCPLIELRWTHGHLASLRVGPAAVRLILGLVLLGAGLLAGVDAGDLSGLLKAATYSMMGAVRVPI